MNTFQQIMCALAFLAVASCGSSTSSSNVSPVEAAQILEAPDIPVAEVTFQISRINNMPGNHQDKLIGSIFNLAKNTDFRITRHLGVETTHILTGMVTAIGDNSGVEVIFAFDIVKFSGERVYRFSGQESTRGTIEDPWTSVDKRTLDRIASQVIFEVNAWLSRAQ